MTLGVRDLRRVINPAAKHVIPAPRFRGGRLREAPLHYSGTNSEPVEDPGLSGNLETC